MSAPNLHGRGTQPATLATKSGSAGRRAGPMYTPRELQAPRLRVVQVKSGPRLSPPQAKPRAQRNAAADWGISPSLRRGWGRQLTLRRRTNHEANTITKLHRHALSATPAKAEIRRLAPVPIRLPNQTFTAATIAAKRREIAVAPHPTTRQSISHTADTPPKEQESQGNDQHG